jgi:FAD/FMN-containing dehydrogenase/Fe-S oxidoreductase
LRLKGDTVDYQRLQGKIEGEVLTGIFDRGRYATDASIYQIMPRAVVVPKSWSDVEAALDFAKEQGVPLLARGGGTSQSGQTVNDALVVDFSKHLNRVLDYDRDSGTVQAEPGLVLDDLNRQLKSDDWWFPVDVSTSSRATLGGMAANNSCGSRSIRYGKMRDNVIAMEAMLTDGAVQHFGAGSDHGSLSNDMRALGQREADEIAQRFPKVSRRVGGYNIDALVSQNPNMAHLLVGSEGTLGLTKSLNLKLAPVLKTKTMGVCHFPSFYAAMDAAQHIVKLGPVAVELVDHTMIKLGRDIPQFRPIVDEFVRGEPAALLLVEFAETAEVNRQRLTALGELMAELGFRWDDPGKLPGGVVEAEDAAFQARIWGVRTQGLNIMMSMRSEGKPVSFVEDCAVPLEHLAEFTSRLTDVFRKHGTDGTWYAHASVGLLHVRPVLNLRQDLGAQKMRAIAEEAFDMVAAFKGSHSGEHGDGIVRSEFHERMFGKRMVRAFEEVKDRFDPDGVLNPGKIVRAPKMDNRDLFRWPPDYRQETTDTVFDWSAWPGGLTGATEMCNNNGACRKSAGGVMCPSYRATRNERDVTRGRANSLRLALTGRLGKDALSSDDMAETMKLCVSCKACKSECPMSIDMAKMKIEVQVARARQQGLSLRERIVANLPRYAPMASRMRLLANLPRILPGFVRQSIGFSADRKPPKFARPFSPPTRDPQDADVLLFADTFSRHFESAALEAAVRVIERGGKRVAVASAPGRNLCCGRTYLSNGMLDRARLEMDRTAAVFRAAIDAGKYVVGLEPSCVLTFRDEAVNLLPDWTAEMGEQVLTFAEYIQQQPGDSFSGAGGKALVHGHCHQKAFGAATATTNVLRAKAGLAAEMIESSCCGMAGSFGYQKETEGVSRQMAELSLAPTVRAAEADTWIVADGFSCRCQIQDTTGRKAEHSAIVLDRQQSDGT